MVSAQSPLLWTVMELAIQVSITLLSQQVAAKIQVIVVLRQQQRTVSARKCGVFKCSSCFYCHFTSHHNRSYKQGNRYRNKTTLFQSEHHPVTISHAVQTVYLSIWSISVCVNTCRRHCDTTPSGISGKRCLRSCRMW